MLDPKLIKEKPEIIREMLRKRNVTFPLDELIEIDKNRRAFMAQLQELKHKRNLIADKIAKMKKAKENVTQTIEEMKSISESITNGDKELERLDKRYRELMLTIPNLVDDSVPYGKDESDNVVVRVYGKPIEIGGDHIKIASNLDLIDMERAAKISGARFYILKNDLVRLNIALISFALDFISKKGYSLLQPPYMIKRSAMEGAIIVTDFEDVIYKIEGDDLYLIGTSEHAIAAMHMAQILES
ncbi:MAG: hypothetical protein QW052_05290 [Candidatus Nitrosocaldaceae archaeon]